MSNRSIFGIAVLGIFVLTLNFMSEYYLHIFMNWLAQ